MFVSWYLNIFKRCVSSIVRGIILIYCINYYIIVVVCFNYIDKMLCDFLYVFPFTGMYNMFISFSFFLKEHVLKMDFGFESFWWNRSPQNDVDSKVVFSSLLLIFDCWVCVLKEMTSPSIDEWERNNYNPGNVENERRKKDVDLLFIYTSFNSKLSKSYFRMK